MKVLVLCVLAILWLQLPTEGGAVCCPTHRLNRNRLCDDCRNGSPYCGRGKCNWFGCNCAGGCRKGLCGGDDEDSRRRRSVVVQDSPRFLADKDGTSGHA